MKKCKETYCVRAQPNTAQAYTLHYKLHIHENDHFNFATTDYVDGTDYIKADLYFLFLNTNHSNRTNLCSIVGGSFRITFTDVKPLQLLNA